MSTPSKKRQRARAWLRAEYKERSIQYERGFREGGRAMRADMMLLFPENREVEIGTKGQQIYTSRIPQFPQVSRSFEVPFATSSSSIDRIVFRPVLMELSQRSQSGIVNRLQWFVWEPTRFDEASYTRTTTYLQSLGRLGYAVRLLDWCLETYSKIGSFGEIRDLVKGTCEELRRVTGQFKADDYAE